MFRTDWPSAPLIYDNLSKSLRKITCQPFNIQVLNETMCPSNMERYKWNGGYALEKLEENEYLRAQQVNLMQKESLSKLREFFKYFMLYSMSDSRVRLSYIYKKIIFINNYSSTFLEATTWIRNVGGNLF